MSYAIWAMKFLIVLGVLAFYVLIFSLFRVAANADEHMRRINQKRR